MDDHQVKNNKNNKITVNKFKSGKFSGLSFKELIEDKRNKKNLNYLTNNKHPAYARFN